MPNVQLPRWSVFTRPRPGADKASTLRGEGGPHSPLTDPTTRVPGILQNVDFIEKDSKRFPDSGGWGYAAFDYDAASDTFTPATLTDQPPQGNDAKCEFACHTIVQAKDYIFTAYGKR